MLLRVCLTDRSFHVPEGTHMERKPAAPTAFVWVAHDEGLAAFCEELIKRGWTILAHPATSSRCPELPERVRSLPDAFKGMTLSPSLFTHTDVLRIGLQVDGGLDSAASLHACGIPRIDLLVMDFPTVVEESMGADANMDTIDGDGAMLLLAAANGGRYIIEPTEFVPFARHLDAGEPDRDAVKRLMGDRARWVAAEHLAWAARHHSPEGGEGSLNVLRSYAFFAATP